MGKDAGFIPLDDLATHCLAYSGQKLVHSFHILPGVSLCNHKPQSDFHTAPHHLVMEEESYSITSTRFELREP